MQNKIISSINTVFKKGMFGLKKHSPEILIVTGVVGVVVSGVMACKATTKLSDILEKTKEDVDAIHKCTDDNTLAEKYTQEDAAKDLTIVYVQTGVKLIKTYAPSVILGTLSICAILTSNHIIRERNLALAAAYATIDKGFKQYRNRVVDKFGEEVERELRYDIKTKTVEESVIDEETGEVIKTEKTISVANIDEHSEYARFFDEYSPYWEKDEDYNFMFLRSQQNYWNDKLRTDGYVFLNDVYKELGIPRTKAGQIVGWVYDRNNPNVDSYIDFGIYDMQKEVVRDFIEGYERSILLDFNVDGNILDYERLGRINGDLLRERDDNKINTAN